MPEHTDSDRPAPGSPPALQYLHLQVGWWSLLLFLLMGMGLEAMHGFKVGAYLDVGNETRRLLWTLAHAHGALLGLVHILFAHTLADRVKPGARWARRASPCLIAASVCLPGGFFLGGTFTYGSDPGLGIVLVPVGGLLLATGIFLTAHALRRS